MNVRSYCSKYYLLSDTKMLMTLNKIGLLLKGVLIDLHAHNFEHSKTSLLPHCLHGHHHKHNLPSPDVKRKEKNYKNLETLRAKSFSDEIKSVS